MLYCELKQKDVINRCNCRRLGKVCNLILDEKSGCICSIVVPGPSRCLGLFPSDQEFVIPWNKICKIGPDVILVEICEEDCLCPVKKSGSFFS